MTNSFKNDQSEEIKNLLSKIESIKLKNVSLKNIAPNVSQITQTTFKNQLKQIQIRKNHNYLILDVRSEKEFENSALPFSVNFPILTNDERHEVGLLYKQVSKNVAINYAYYLAKQKEKEYLEKINNLGDKKNIIVYCWRGGGRSKYVTNLFLENNYNVLQLEGGQQKFRKEIYNTLYTGKINAISLSGLTGCGKSEILEFINLNFTKIPILHIEECAGHASSVFGEIRFKLMKKNKAKNQQDFETNLFLNIIKYQNNDETYPIYLTEKESKRIGNLNLPPTINNALNEEKHILITSSLNNRLMRLKNDYLQTEDSCKQIQRLLSFLNFRLGTKKVNELKELISEKKHLEFLEDMMLNYYDKVYKKTKTPPLISVKNDSIKKCSLEIINFLENYCIL